MNQSPVTFEDLYLKAKSVVNPRKLSECAEGGEVGAALLSTGGNIYVGVNIGTACQMGFCAEHAAAAAMVTAGENRVLKMIAVGTDGSIVPPCGRCREFISDLHGENLNTEVMLSEGVILTLRELLPYDWRTATSIEGY
jgi:cytidine deaminase